MKHRATPGSHVWATPSGPVALAAPVRRASELWTYDPQYRVCTSKVRAAGLGVLAFKRGYTQSSEADRDDDLGLAHHALAALDALRAATATLS